MACTCSSLETTICTSQAGRWVAGFGLTEWRAPQSGGGMSIVRLFSCESFLWGWCSGSPFPLCRLPGVLPVGHRTA